MFKTFFGIIVFGMANGFILLPIILSLVGPTPDPEEKSEERARLFSSRRSTLRAEQIAAMIATHGLKDTGEDPDAGKAMPKRSADVADFTAGDNEAGKTVEMNNTKTPIAAGNQVN